MLQRILTCALLAGLATGVLLWGLHATLTVPLIAHAEVYEEQAHAKSAQNHAHEHAAATAAEAHAESWTPKGWQRMALTLLTTIVSTVGFALMLVSGAVLAYGEINVWNGMAFGLAGFAATGLATSLGLAPELPGIAGADLFLRQVWWIGTAGATAAGLAAIFLSPRPALKVLGVAMIVTPHLVGAPAGEMGTSLVPAELSALFAARSLVLQGVMWVILGLICGWVWQRQARGASQLQAA